MWPNNLYSIKSSLGNEFYHTVKLDSAPIPTAQISSGRGVQPQLKNLTSHFGLRKDPWEVDFKPPQEKGNWGCPDYFSAIQEKPTHLES
jgi:hypothetical protein